MDLHATHLIITRRWSHTHALPLHSPQTLITRFAISTESFRRQVNVVERKFPVARHHKTNRRVWIWPVLAV